MRAYDRFTPRNLVGLEMLKSAALAASFVMSVTALPALAQDAAYPSQPIKLIVPFGAGGPTDVVGRVVTNVLQGALGQSVVVINRPGAGGAIGTRAVAQADPDGYTLLLGTVATLAALPAVQKNPGFDPVTSFIAVAKLTESTAIAAAPYDAPFKTVQELVAYARANPGVLNFSSAGVGNQTHLNAEIFKFKTGTNIVHVPYKSGAEMVNALLTNQAQLTFTDLSGALAHIQDKKIRALAVTSRTRHPALPDVPTMIESGVQDFTSVFWTGVLAPAGTPRPIVEKLNAALNAGLKTQEIRELLSRIMATPQPETASDFAAYVASEAQRWRDTVKAAGIQIE